MCLVLVRQFFFDLATYMASLEKMKQVIEANSITWMYTSHGPPVDNARAKIDEYISHRMARIEEVMSVIASASSSGKTCEKIVYEMYAHKVAKELLPAAGCNTMQALLKLELDGRIRRVLPTAQDFAASWVPVKACL